jgi:hypothetical protein
MVRQIYLLIKASGQLLYTCIYIVPIKYVNPLVDSCPLPLICDILIIKELQNICMGFDFFPHLFVIFPCWLVGFWKFK